MAVIPGNDTVLRLTHLPQEPGEAGPPVILLPLFVVGGRGGGSNEGYGAGGRELKSSREHVRMMVAEEGGSLWVGLGWANGILGLASPGLA